MAMDVSGEMRSRAQLPLADAIGRRTSEERMIGKRERRPEGKRRESPPDDATTHRTTHRPTDTDGSKQKQRATVEEQIEHRGAEEAAKQHFSRFCLCSTLIHHRDTRENLPSPACTAAVMLIRSSSSRT